MDKYPDGKMETDDFIKTFKIAFPERPDEKIQKLAVNMSNKDGKICKQFYKTFTSQYDKCCFTFAAMANMLILFYLFSGGKLEDNLVGIFNLFDADGNKVTPPQNMFLMHRDIDFLLTLR